METTHEQRMAVRRDECRSSGHIFTETATLSTLAPQSVLCHNCGARWRIHPDDVDENFGANPEERDMMNKSLDGFVEGNIAETLTNELEGLDASLARSVARSIHLALRAEGVETYRPTPASEESQ